MEPRAFNSGTNIVPPSSVCRRGVLDVVEDVNFLMEHLNDPNFDYHSGLQSLSDSGTGVFELEREDVQSRSESTRYPTASRTETRGTAFEYVDESPYPEVRAAISNVDDPTMPVNTFRTWLLGLLYTVVVSAANQVLTMRYPFVIVTGIVAQLTALPFGKVLERVLPTTRFHTLGYTWTLNPGPFNIKEHVLITVMVNVSFAGAYATDIVATQRFFYNQSISHAYELMLVLSTQLIGFSLGGLLRRFLIYPSSMIWPNVLVNSTIFNTLHRAYGKSDGRHISREKFFAIVVACSFAWYFVPGFLWTGLSFFNWVCWIAPNNVVVNTLFGTSTGLGMSILSFDWSMIAFSSNPLIPPWWSEANSSVGLVFCVWIIAPILYFTNSFFMGYLPLSASVAFDNTGMAFDPTRVITNGVFDNTKYEAYSPAFLSTTLAIAYGTAFATFASLVVHVILWYRRDIISHSKCKLKDQRDVHSRLMQGYAEVPQWWYALLGIATVPLLLVTVEVYSTEFPIWAAFTALFFAALMSIPVGTIQAITGQELALTVICELFAGYVLPGRPLALMIFKGVTFTGIAQAVSFASDLKLGHYMKIPPRLMFVAQVVATLISSIVVTFVQDWMFANIVDMCQPYQPQSFTCPGTTTFATSSLIWGGIGPQRMFGLGTMYCPIMWCFFVGAVLPIPFYCLARRYPLSYWRYINVPVIFSGVGFMPPATGINYASWLLVGFLFQWFMRRHHFRWWMRYNYILAGGLDAGTAFGQLFLFFSLQLPKDGITLNWWGNTVWQNTADALGTPLYVLPPGQTFGPSKW